MTSTASPSATYRLQLRPDFGFDAAAGQVDYLADLGISHLYLSPILEAVPGSPHGYDVVDHTRVREELGGLAGFRRLVDAAHRAGLGIVVDVVPNHMAVPAPAYLNEPLWELLRLGREAPRARWFDVDWEAGDDTILMPVLGESVPEAIEAGTLRLDRGGPDGDETVLRYWEHEFPLRPGTGDLPLPQLVAAQWYRLAHWRAADLSLNYRRFFDVTTLVAVRVEDENVFAQTHRLLLDLVRDGSIDGLRIDHPDGLADPRGYLEMLAAASGGAWVVVEKILEGDERLPSDWPCAGTTGYDTLKRVGGVFVDPAGEEPLMALLAVLNGQIVRSDEVALTAKKEVGLRVQAAEVRRLVRLLGVVCAGIPEAAGMRPETLRRAVSALLVSLDRYRAYVRPEEPAGEESIAVLREAADRARAWLASGDEAALDLIADIALGLPAGDGSPESESARVEFLVRFQQTCGPIQAKGIEDTAFYRWFQLTALNEVGGNPGEFAVTPADLHRFARRIDSDWPATMTTLSTHDTKRSEDVRARLTPLSERPVEWAAWLNRARELTAPTRPEGLDVGTEYLLWQTLVGTWPITTDRLTTYARKAIREACVHTSWTEEDADYEKAVTEFIDGVLTEPEVAGHVEAWLADTAPSIEAVVLGQKLLQLTHPGAPDVYQGTELVDLSLVDPDNRRPVAYEERRRRLAALDAGHACGDLDDRKLLVTSRALRLRRRRPAAFRGDDSGYQPVAASTPHALAAGRTHAGSVEVVAVVTRLPVALEAAGGWGDHVLWLPEGRWRDVLTGALVVADDAGVPLQGLLSQHPVALLEREEREHARP